MNSLALKGGYMPPTLLTIDIGTSATKAALFSLDGNLLALQTREYGIHHPQPDWAEQDPRDWWTAACQCSSQVLAEAGHPPVAGVAVSGQTPSLVAVDRQGQPLRSAILWLDRRAHPQVAWLETHLGSQAAIAASGNLLDSYYGGVKWLWFRQDEPELYRRTWQIWQASSYLLYHLAGTPVLEYSQAGLCSPCFNLHTQSWDAGICACMGLDLDKLPPLVPATTIVGRVTAEAARQSGIPEGTPVCAGGGDFALSCLGAGSARSGHAVVMLGTAGNLLVPNPAGTDPRLINTIHVSGGGLSLGGVYAGGVVTWLRTLLGLDPVEAYTQLEAEAAATPPGAGGVIFLPYLMGERTPIWDPQARGLFFGLTQAQRRGHLYRAALEGVAYAFRKMLAIVGATGTPIHQVTLTDGGARSPLWRQIFADVLGLPVHWQPGGGTLLGTALLAGVACGALPGFEVIDSWLGPVTTILPQPETAAVYQRGFDTYRQLYSRLKDLMGN
jgi:xylulokinase